MQVIAELFFAKITHHLDAHLDQDLRDDDIRKKSNDSIVRVITKLHMHSWISIFV